MTVYVLDYGNESMYTSVAAVVRSPVFLSKDAAILAAAETCADVVEVIIEA